MQFINSGQFSEGLSPLRFVASPAKEILTGIRDPSLPNSEFAEVSEGIVEEALPTIVYDSPHTS